ncbi:CaiB/BaiF CoA-transferase family protein [Pseudoruegeria sp. SK021]|uniref:CaiB/BaiF CoA transferase family protein n=1 Tax=Pseudoruegeria sp. SK021 TaxID=1933035 RepID=UPI000A25D4A6|nr:CoA transferase [Pseudoruegeria sp. SK021]OSP53672.1 carnitine dehydratase [Pseudoruegeria sp. SK021]
MDKPKKGALDGLRVIDLTRVLSGPFCTAILADLGADVIKIEPPKGDPVRGQGTIRDGHSWYFANFNRNKKSVVIDLYSTDGKDILRQLLSTADVVVENFRPGTMDKLGLGTSALKALNPRLITASVNGYGTDGPYADRPAFDFVVQAMSGFMSVNGDDGAAAMRAAPPMTDLVAGVYAATGILAAVRSRDITGQGQPVEVSMMNGIISMMAYLATEYFATGQLPQRTGNDHPLVAPYGLYRVADGEVAIAPSNDVILKRFFDAIDLGWVLDDPRFDTNDKRFGKRPELQKLIEARLGAQTKDHWIKVLNAAGVPCGRVQDFDQVFADPQVQAQQMALDVDYPGRGPVRMLGFPIKLGATPCVMARPSPELGEHTTEVLRDNGLTDTQIARLRDEGVIGGS